MLFLLKLKQHLTLDLITNIPQILLKKDLIKFLLELIKNINLNLKLIIEFQVKLF